MYVLYIISSHDDGDNGGGGGVGRFWFFFSLELFTFSGMNNRTIKTFINLQYPIIFIAVVSVGFRHRRPFRFVYYNNNDVSN